MHTATPKRENLFFIWSLIHFLSQSAVRFKSGWLFSHSNMGPVMGRQVCICSSSKTNRCLVPVYVHEMSFLMQFLLHSFTFFQCPNCRCRNRLIEVGGDYRPPFFNYIVYAICKPVCNFVNVSETGFLVHRTEEATCSEFALANENLRVGYGHFPFVVHWQIVFITATSFRAGRWT